jgi:acetyl-CoA carboxylase biotin carboxyl carrier protein
MKERVKASESANHSLVNFVDERVAPLAKMFSRTPLMSLRIETPEGTVTFEKSAAGALPVDLRVERFAESGKHAHRPRSQNSSITPDAEPGHQYDTINAEIVGVFHPAADLPFPGAPVADGQVLGFVEALKLRNPVRNAQRGLFVAQIAEDGQAVEFGEALFVINHGEPADAPLAQASLGSAAQAPAEEEAAQTEPLEPPRL